MNKCDRVSIGLVALVVALSLWCGYLLSRLWPYVVSWAQFLGR